MLGDDVFFECMSLKSIDIPDSVKESKGCTFRKCGIEEIILPKQLTKLKPKTFSECSCLKSVFFPESICIIENAAFYHCKELETIELPKHIKNVCAGSFFNCSNLNKITFNNNPESITAYAFDLCTNLISVEYKISLKDAIQIGFGVYKKDDNTYSIFLKNKKSFNKQSISDLIIPSEIDGTPVTEIASGGFSELNSIKNVFIANNIKIIGYDAF